MSALEEMVAEEQESFEAEEEAEAEAFESEDEDAAAAESEDGDESPDAEPELRAIGPQEIQKAERAIATQRKKLAGILGDEYVAHDCLLCGALGFVPELPPPGTTFTTVQDEAGIALVAAPPEPERQLVRAKDKAPCDWCDAEGFVDTGSKNPNTKFMPCTKCAGNGWVIVAVDEPVTPAFGAVPTVQMPDAQAGTENVGADAWGRPAGHQHWGVPPAMIQG
jgi:hypothetical protein